MKVESIGFKILGVLGLIGIWATFSTLVGEFFFPSPMTVFAIVYEVFAAGELLYPTYITFLRVLGGMGLSLVIGLIVGILAGRSYKVDSLTSVIIVVLMTTPSLVIVLLSLMALGIYDFVPALAAAFVHSPFTVVIVRGVMRSLSPELIEMAKAYGAKLRHMVRDIYIPYLVPALLAESRVGYAHSWKIVLLTEVFGMSAGVGYNVKIYFTNYELEKVVAWVAIFLVVVLAVEEVLRVIERKATAWRRM